MMDGSGWTRRAAGSGLDGTTTTGSAGGAAAAAAGPKNADADADAEDVSSSDMAETTESELACERATASDCG